MTEATNMKMSFYKLKDVSQTNCTINSTDSTLGDIRKLIANRLVRDTPPFWQDDSYSSLALFALAVQRFHPLLYIMAFLNPKIWAILR